jgi:hypothetical protein
LPVDGVRCAPFVLPFVVLAVAVFLGYCWRGGSAQCPLPWQHVCQCPCVLMMSFSTLQWWGAFRSWARRHEPSSEVQKEGTMALVFSSCGVLPSLASFLLPSDQPQDVLHFLYFLFTLFSLHLSCFFSTMWTLAVCGVINLWPDTSCLLSKKYFMSHVVGDVGHVFFHAVFFWIF